jgi:hypothetical protein
MRTEERERTRGLLLHAPPLIALLVMAVVWTWPLVLHFRDHIPGFAGDNFSFLWNLWWVRKALSAPELELFRSTYLLSPFGVDLINHPHTMLQGYMSATALSGLTVIEAENTYILASVFLNAASAYALVCALTRNRWLGLLGGMVFGGSPYIAAHLMGHFDLLTAWVLPLFALFFKRALDSGRITPALGCGMCVAVAAYTAYYHVVYIVLFALSYTVAAWHSVRASPAPRPQTPVLFTIRLLIVGLIALDVGLIALIAGGEGLSFTLGGREISATGLHNPLSLLWLLAAGWILTKWRTGITVQRPAPDAFWRAAQTVTIAAAVFCVLCLPLIAQAFRIAVSGRYVTQAYFWRSAPRGVDALAPFMGNPFHPLYGGITSRWYEALGLDRIEAVGWIGVVPAMVLLIGRGRWFDADEARRWKVVLVVFAIWSLGPFLTVAGFDMGLPLPQALARFVPVVENARMPGRALVCVYLSLAVLMGLRLAAVKAAGGLSRTGVTALVAIAVAIDYLHAPIPLTALSRPAVYEQLAAIEDSGAVIEVPFGIGDGLTRGRGSQDRRLLYHATIHGHPVVGGYIGRMPPGVAQAYDAMPVVGNLLRLSNGEPAVDEELSPSLPFRYLVLDRRAAGPLLVEYIRSTLDMDLLAVDGGKELYAVQGAKPKDLTARK